MTTVAGGSRSRRRESVSSPSSPAIFTSSRTTWGRNSMQRVMPSPPEAAVFTSQPSYSSTWRPASRMPPSRPAPRPPREGPPPPPPPPPPPLGEAVSPKDHGPARFDILVISHQTRGRTEGDRNLPGVHPDAELEVVPAQHRLDRIEGPRRPA